MSQTSVSRIERRRSLFRVAASQSGYFTARQALAVGFSYQAQHHHVREGNWIRVDRGICRLFEWPTGIHDDLVRWTLWAGQGSVVSHETALGVHGVGEFSPTHVHLTVPNRLTRSAAGVILHSGVLGEAEIEGREGFAVTNPTRTLIDIAGLGTDGDQLDRAIRECRDAGLVTARLLRRSAETVDITAALRIEQSLGRLGL